MRKAGVKDEARRAWEQFVAYFPKASWCRWFSSGWVSHGSRRRNTLEASVAFQRVSRRAAWQTCAAPLATTWLSVSASWVDRRPPARSRAAITTSSRRTPAVAQVGCQLGDIDEVAGALEKAAAEYEAALGAKPGASLRVELAFRLGRTREAMGQTDAAIASYAQAVAATDKDHPYRLSALARSAALYEKRHDFAKALEAYRDIVKHAQDQELVAAATDRVSQLEHAARRGKR